jgi:hypothetical protein
MNETTPIATAVFATANGGGLRPGLYPLVPGAAPGSGYAYGSETESSRMWSDVGSGTEQPPATDASTAASSTQYPPTASVAGTRQFPIPQRPHRLAQLRKGGTMSRGSFGANSMSKVDALSWLTSVKVGSEKRGSSSGGGSAEQSRLSSRSRNDSKTKEAPGGVRRTESMVHTPASEEKEREREKEKEKDRREGEGPMLQDEYVILSLLLLESDSKVMSSH